jgi:hypothetical protein
MVIVLIGTIILTVLALVTCIVACIKAIRSITESSNRLQHELTSQIVDELSTQRQFWQHQLQIALNRLYNPDLASMQSAVSSDREPQLSEVKYVGEEIDQFREDDANANAQA